MPSDLSGVNEAAEESVARAIHAADFPLDDGTRWDRCSVQVQDDYRRKANAALAALASARRRELCPTCAANEHEQFVHRKVMHDCDDGTVDAGSLAVAWLTDAGVLRADVGVWCWEHAVYGHAERPFPDCKLIQLFREVMP